MSSSSENITIRICYTEVFPFIVHVSDGIAPKGMQGSIFSNIVKSLDLKWIRVPAPTSTWGQCESNGTCRGQLEPLQQGTADLALGPVVITQETFDNLRVIWPSYYSTLDVIAGFKSPFEAAGRFTIFNLYPTLIWCLILVCLMVLPVLAKIISRLGERRDRLSLIDHWSPFMEIFLLETPSIQYSTSTLRILFTGWMLAALVISSIGSATLKSVMTVLKPAGKVETLRDVLQLDLSKTRIRITAGTGLLHLLQRADYKAMNDLAEKVLRGDGLTHPLNLGATWLLRELETERSIFILGCELVPSFFYSPPLLKLQGTQGYTYCSKGVLGHYYSGFIALRKPEPVLEMIFDEFDKRVLWLTESPFPLLPHYEYESPLVADRYIKAKELKQPPPSPTSVDELSGAFIVFGALITVETLVLASEMLWSSRRKLLESLAKSHMRFTRKTKADIPPESLPAEAVI